VVSLFDLLPIMIAGMCAGIAWAMLTSLGVEWKLPISAAVAIAAWSVARLILRSVGRLTDKATRRGLRQLAPDELEARFLDPSCTHLNLILLELRRRGHDIDRFRARLIERLQSDSGPSRLFAFRALCDAFPDDQKKLSQYSPYESQEICRMKVQVLIGE
jgi:hypothetical protein